MTSILIDNGIESYLNPLHYIWKALFYKHIGFDEAKTTGFSHH